MQIRSELRPLTSIRGLAAWYVVLYHIRLSGAPSLPPALIAFFAKGYLAVDLFFMLSGFVIWLNYADQVRVQRLSGVPRFLWRRLARIYPLHLFMLAVALAFAAACQVTGRGVPADFPLRELPLQLLLVQNWGFTDELTWNHPAWSISCELAAYLLFPLLAMTVDWGRWRTAMMMGALAAILLLLYGIFASAGLSALGDDISHFGLWRCLLEFMAGTILSALWQRWRDRPLLPAILCGLVVVAGLVAFLAGAPEPLALPPAFAAATLGLALSSTMAANPLNGAIIHRIGEISYATYMVHTLLFLLFKLLFVRDPANVPLPLLGLFVLLNLLASFALYHGVERPAQRWMNRRLFAVRAPVAASPETS